MATAGQTFGLTGQFAFEQEKLSLNEALAKAGGLIDNRANPSQVFLYRLEFRSVLEHNRREPQPFPAGHEDDPDGVQVEFPRSFGLLLHSGLQDA